MSKPTRSETIEELAELLFRALRGLGATAAVLMVDTGDGNINSHEAGESEDAIIRLLVQGSLGSLKQHAEEKGVKLLELPDKLEQFMEARDSKLSGSSFIHLQDFTRKAKF
jgi:hypothetical protein